MKDMDIHVADQKSSIIVFSKISCHGGKRDEKSSKTSLN